MAFRVKLANVTRIKPAIPKRGSRLFGRLKIAARHVIAAHQDFAIFGDLDVDASHWLSGSSTPNMKGMTEADDRCGFCEAIALHYNETEVGPELLEIGRKRRSTNDEAAEFPAKQAMD
jgi:hypothetical protein